MSGACSGSRRWVSRSCGDRRGHRRQNPVLAVPARSRAPGRGGDAHHHPSRRRSMSERNCEKGYGLSEFRAALSSDLRTVHPSGPETPPAAMRGELLLVLGGRPSRWLIPELWPISWIAAVFALTCIGPGDSTDSAHQKYPFPRVVSRYDIAASRLIPQPPSTLSVLHSENPALPGPLASVNQTLWSGTSVRS